MMCIACGDWSQAEVCVSCERSLVPASDRWVNGVVVRAAFGHEAAARRLVHRMKYDGSRRAARWLASRLGGAVPCAEVIVPLERVFTRRWATGADGARLLATELARREAIPVRRAMAAPLWMPARAGRGRDVRRPPAWRPTAPPGERVVLVDDVITTGATIDSAIRAARAKGWNVVAAVCATSAPAVTSVYRVADDPGGYR